MLNTNRLLTTGSITAVLLISSVIAGQHITTGTFDAQFQLVDDSEPSAVLY